MIKGKLKGILYPGDFQARRNENERNGGGKNEKREGKQSGEKVAESRWVDIGCILFIN